jgi:hypothetical protein
LFVLFVIGWEIFIISAEAISITLVISTRMSSIIKTTIIYRPINGPIITVVPVIPTLRLFPWIIAVRSVTISVNINVVAFIVVPSIVYSSVESFINGRPMMGSQSRPFRNEVDQLLG